MQTVVTPRHYHTPTRIANIKIYKNKMPNLGDKIKLLEPSYTASGNITWCHHFGKNLASSAKDEYVHNL